VSRYVSFSKAGTRLSKKMSVSAWLEFAMVKVIRFSMTGIVIVKIVSLVCLDNVMVKIVHFSMSGLCHAQNRQIQVAGMCRAQNR
jgi:hypothetical protein